MSPYLHGVARWPGVQSFFGAVMTVSHGMTPGVCVFRCGEPLDKPIAEFGDLTITDGNDTVVLPDCRVQSVKKELGPNGFYLILEIADRRWRWRDFGFINGCYNQMTPFGKLIPWTIRSPTELATLCLEAMGETGYELHLPEGINNPGPNYPNPVINVSGVNPPVDWQGVPPAQALQQLADRCGCRIVYQWSKDRVWVGPIGQGQALPAGSIAKRLQTIMTPMAPSGVGVIGSPTRYQVRLALTAVGKEWDGSYWPINLLSYAPKITTPATVQISKVTFADLAPDMSIKLTLTDPKGEPHTIGFSSGDGEISTAQGNCLDAVAAAAQSGDSEWSQVSGALIEGQVTIEANAVNVPFDLTADYYLEEPPDPPPQVVVETTQVAQAPVAITSWAKCSPPEFFGVTATDRLTAADAQRLAAESVWRCYQLTGIDVSGNGPPAIPGYGQLKRTIQLILQDTQVDQIVPSPVPAHTRRDGYVRSAGRTVVRNLRHDLDSGNTPGERRVLLVVRTGHAGRDAGVRAKV